MNGIDLAASDDVAESYPNPYSSMLGKPDEMRAWQVPTTILRDGLNQLEVRVESGEPARIAYIDLAIG